MNPYSRLPQPFARDEVLAAGISGTSLLRAVRAGLVVRLDKGLYAVRSTWSALEPWRRHLALSQAAARLTRDAILSHASLAAVLGLPYPAYPPKLVTMTLLDDGRTSRSDGWRQFHRGATPAEHIEIRGGRPRLTLPRTVIDCGRQLHGRDALAIADGALRSGGVDLDVLLEMRQQQRRWPGVARLNDVLLRADGRRENWLESASAWSISRWGLPDPTPQVDVFSGDGEFLARVDNLWPELGVVGEADGLGKYLLDGTGEDAVTARLEAESVRQKGLEREGLTLARWTTAEAISGDEIRTSVAPFLWGPVPRVTAVFRCSCCHGPLEDCTVDAYLREWRAKVRETFARKVW